MAETLAIMHWVVRVDANDVEFVLAPPDSDGEKGGWENVLGEHAVWMLDFDLCRDMAMDNPRPEEGSFLWKAFREMMYLGASQRIVGDGPGDRRLELAKLFVDLLEQGPR